MEAIGGPCAGRCLKAPYCDRYSCSDLGHYGDLRLDDNNIDTRRRQDRKRLPVWQHVGQLKIELALAQSYGIQFPPPLGFGRMIQETTSITAYFWCALEH